ncbi:hypothetical protein K437DRAFT_296086 [Tilletiaria anomala UBC 951]|uniref:Uncharacterized protein n=1 Tax=Tilletiaria anomala (strain ATCC 24038 / CBS 436.72 / UBC 951) TaxID=1037660 RepID=A0A066VL98_TILAU|nr:uncharacterized protein K437DRAFT_296086 [Tilletiaria anomala UBC 951]KDN39544.1 hypothetical protein K437DRAFT_296086 [Tilletiaria anomala UBC 951]
MASAAAIAAAQPSNSTSPPPVQDADALALDSVAQTTDPDVLRATIAALRTELGARDGQLATLRADLALARHTHDALLARSAGWADSLQELAARVPQLQDALAREQAARAEADDRVKDLRLRAEESRRAFMRLQGESEKERKAAAAVRRESHRRSFGSVALAPPVAGASVSPPGAAAPGSLLDEEEARELRKSKRASLAFGPNGTGISIASLAATFGSGNDPPRSGTSASASASDLATNGTGSVRGLKGLSLLSASPAPSPSPSPSPLPALFGADSKVHAPLEAHADSAIAAGDASHARRSSPPSAPSGAASHANRRYSSGSSTHHDAAAGSELELFVPGAGLGSRDSLAGNGLGLSGHLSPAPSTSALSSVGSPILEGHEEDEADGEGHDGDEASVEGSRRHTLSLPLQQQQRRQRTREEQQQQDDGEEDSDSKAARRRSAMMGGGGSLMFSSTPGAPGSGPGLASVPASTAGSTLATMRLEAQLQAKQAEVERLKLEMTGLRAHMHEAHEARLASESCLKALRAFIAEGAGTTGIAPSAPESLASASDAAGADRLGAAFDLKEVKLPPLPTDADADELSDDDLAHTPFHAQHGRLPPASASASWSAFKTPSSSSGAAHSNPPTSSATTWGLRLSTFPNMIRKTTADSTDSSGSSSGGGGGTQAGLLSASSSSSGGALSDATTIESHGTSAREEDCQPGIVSGTGTSLGAVPSSSSTAGASLSSLWNRTVNSVAAARDSAIAAAASSSSASANLNGTSASDNSAHICDSPQRTRSASTSTAASTPTVASPSDLAANAASPPGAAAAGPAASVSSPGSGSSGGGAAGALKSLGGWFNKRQSFVAPASASSCPSPLPSVTPASATSASSGDVQGAVEEEEEDNALTPVTPQRRKMPSPPFASLDLAEPNRTPTSAQPSASRFPSLNGPASDSKDAPLKEDAGVLGDGSSSHSAAGTTTSSRLSARSAALARLMNSNPQFDADAATSSQASTPTQAKAPSLSKLPTVVPNARAQRAQQRSASVTSDEGFVPPTFD